MSAQRPFFARLAWIVSLTILLGALLPSLSQAMVSQQTGGFAEICSATGATVVLLNGEITDGGHDKSSTDSSSMNCPFCAIHHGAPSLPPSELVWVLPTTLRFEAPQLFLQSPRPLFAWAPTLARGPPSAA